MLYSGSYSAVVMTVILISRSAQILMFFFNYWFVKHSLYAHFYPAISFLRLVETEHVGSPDHQHYFP